MFKYHIKNLYKSHLEGLKKHLKGSLIFVSILGAFLIFVATLNIMDNTIDPFTFIILFLGLFFPIIIYASPSMSLNAIKKYTPYLYTADYIYTLEKDAIVVDMDDQGRKNITKYYYDRIFKVVAYPNFIIIYVSHSQMLVLPYDDLILGDKSDVIIYLNYAFNERITVIEKK